MLSITRYRNLSLLTVLTLGAATGSFGSERVAFTAAFQEWLYDRSGKLVLTQTGLYAVRSDGSTVRGREVTRPNSSEVVMQRAILDLANATEVGVDALTESVTTMPLSREAVDFYKRPASGCTSEPEPVRGNILGYEVVRDVEKIENQGTRTFRKELWRAPALDCFALKEMLFIGPTETELRLSTVREVVQVALGEPASSLFERPSGYVERSPSEKREEFQKRYPGALCPTCLAESDRQPDEIYYGRRSRGR